MKAAAAPQQKRVPGKAAHRRAGPAPQPKAATNRKPEGTTKPEAGMADEKQRRRS